MERARLTIPGVTLVLLALAVISLLVGCGKDSTSAEPFVGTWRDADSAGGTSLVIAKTHDGYLGTLVFAGGLETASPRPTLALPLTRLGDKLVDAGAEHQFGIVIVYLPDTGRLKFSNRKSPGGAWNKPVEMVKVSGSTTIPSQSP